MEIQMNQGLSFFLKGGDSITLPKMPFCVEVFLRNCAASEKTVIFYHDDGRREARMRPSMFDEDDTDDSPSLQQRTVFRPRVGLSQAVVDPVSLGLDASVLDYDGFVEKKNEAASISGAGKGIGGQARYIGGLVAKAEERKKVLEEVHERKLAREREAEGALYSDKEVFVTSSYAATLELRKLEAEKEAKTAFADEAAASKAGMSGIFKSMLFGGGAIGDSALACSISGSERARIPLAPYTSSEKSLAPPLVPLPLSSAYPRNAPFFLLSFVLVCKVCVGAYSVERRKKGVLLSAGERANERGTDVWGCYALEPNAVMIS